MCGIVNYLILYQLFEISIYCDQNGLCDHSRCSYDLMERIHIGCAVPVVRLISMALCLCPRTLNWGSDTSWETPTELGPSFHLYRISRMVYPTAITSQWLDCCPVTLALLSLHNCSRCHTSQYINKTYARTRISSGTKHAYVDSCNEIFIIQFGYLGITQMSSGKG